jgi:hypothetical protein
MYMDVDTISWCCFADVGPRGREAEMVGELAHRGPVTGTCRAEGGTEVR